MPQLFAPDAFYHGKLGNNQLSCKTLTPDFDRFERLGVFISLYVIESTFLHRYQIISISSIR